MQSFSPTLRLARPEDAPAISKLYYEAYMPANGSDPRQCYPFSQFLEPDWVENIVRSSTIRWFVAEVQKEIIGTCGAVVNIGTKDDRVAECFGLVIDKKCRLQHFGTELFKRLCDSLNATEDGIFMIGETRTSHPGGWKVVKKCSFIPLGFEPYAHFTPAGSESMLLTGKILPAALIKRNIGVKTSSSVYALSEFILSQLSCSPLSPHKSEDAYVLSTKIAVNQLGLLENPACFEIPQIRNMTCDIEIFEDESVRQPMEMLKNLTPHKAGIISLQRLQGKDAKGIRYRRRYFLVKLDDHLVAYALTVYDKNDKRLRIIDLRTLIDGIQGIIIQHILKQAAHDTIGSTLTVVVDVRADNVRLHATLSRLGFFPTGYYPALIAEEDYRIDAVQFTRLYNLDFEKARNSADFKEWPMAIAVVSSISGGVGFEYG